MEKTGVMFSIFQGQGGYSKIAKQRFHTYSQLCCEFSSGIKTKTKLVPVVERIDSKPSSSNSQLLEVESEVEDNSKNKTRRSLFGILLDIDGVLVRGRHVIPSAKEAIKKLLSSRVPTIFLTNSGCESEKYKAKLLSTQLHQMVILSSTFYML